MEYQVYVKSVASDPQYVKEVILGTSTNVHKIAELAKRLVDALGDTFYPQPEECEVGIRRKAKGGYQYLTYTELIADGKPAALHFGDEEVRL